MRARALEVFLTMLTVCAAISAATGCVRSSQIDGMESAAVNTSQPTTALSPVPHGDFLILPSSRETGGARQLARAIVGEARVAINYEWKSTDDLKPASPSFLPGVLVSSGVRVRVDDLGPIEVKSSFVYETESGERRSVEIARWRPSLPFPVTEPVGSLTMRTGFVLEAPAVFIYPEAAVADREVSIDIWWLWDGVLTQLTGGGTLGDIVRVAESVR
jgi:hypothetical protein